MSDADIVRSTGLNASYMKRMWDGSEPSVENAAKVSRAVGWTLGEMYEGDIYSKPKVTIHGYSGGGDMWTEAQSGVAKSFTLNVISNGFIAIEVTTNDWAPRYQRGDIVCGTRSVGSNLHNLIGRDCIIETADGGRVIKYLARGPRKGAFTLKSFLPTTDDIQDVKIVWAAPIELVVRNADR